MRRPAVFFDRDNTLIVGNDYLGDPAKVVLVAGAAAAVANCRHLGYAVVVVSNQSGVARGMFTEDDVQAVNAKMDAMLLAAHPNAVVDRHEYCCFHPDGTVEQYRGESDRRKPRPGMVYAAAQAMALDLPASWMIGDAPRDIAAGRAAGCRTILIIDPTLAPSPAALAAQDVAPDFTVGSLIEAAEVVSQQTNRPAVPAGVRTPPVEAAAPKVAPPPVFTPAAVAAVLTPPATAMTVKATPASATTPIVAVKPAQPAEGAPRVASAPATDRAASTAGARVDTARLEVINQQILMELKKFNEARHDDFSLSKLIAGIIQTLALAALPVAYVLYRNDAGAFTEWLLAAIFLQTFTVALLVMGRQR